MAQRKAHHIRGSGAAVAAALVGLVVYPLLGDRAAATLGTSDRSTKARAASPLSGTLRDRKAPGAPKRLTVRAVGPTSLLLVWKRSKDNVGVAGYRLYRNSKLAGRTSRARYTLSGLKCRTSYRLSVRAFDARGNVSRKASVRALTSNCTGPAPQPPGGPPPFGAFYVSPDGSDSNPGTLSKPWRTIGRAMTMLTAGQTAYVRAGTYEEALDETCGDEYNSLSWNVSGTLEAPITLSGFPGEERQVVVKTRLKLNGNWQRLRNLVVDRNHTYSSVDSACTGHSNVAVYGDDDEVSGLEVRHSNMSGILIGSGKPARARIVGNWLHDNGAHTSLDHGVYWSSGTGGVLASNLIERSQAYGVQMYPAPSGQTITQNTIVSSGYERAGILLNTTGSGIAVVNNISAFNTGPGIRVSGNGCFGCFADQNLLFGNSVDYDGGSGITIYRTIRLDPRFVDRGAGDYHLLADSPAVDAARADLSMKYDLDGILRPQGPAPDVGAYER